MKKIYNQQEECRGSSQQKGIKKSIGKPLPAQIKDHALENLKLGRRIFKKLGDVEDLLEIIAREIKRQLDRVE